MDMSLRSDDPVEACASFLWCVFLTQDEMAEFVRHSIGNHSSTSSEYVKFLAGHSSVGDIDKLQKKVYDATKSAKAAKDEAVKATNKSDKASTQTDKTAKSSAEVAKIAADLQKMVKKLSDNVFLEFVVVGGLETPSRTPIVKPTKREAGLMDGEERTYTSMSTITHPSKHGEASFPKDFQLEVRLWKPKQPGQLCLISMASYAWLFALRPCKWDCIHLPFLLKRVLPQAVTNQFGNRLDFVSELELAARLTSSTLIWSLGPNFF
jgi:hypothetical protein